jgi:putative transposase
MPEEVIAVSRQCKLLALTRSVIYAHKKRQQDTVDVDEERLLQLLDEEYTRHRFYGTRRMTQYLLGLGYVINRKRVQRLMRTLGLAGMAHPVPTPANRIHNTNFIRIY